MALTIKRERFTLHTPCVEVPVRVITYNLIFRDFALTFFPGKASFCFELFDWSDALLCLAFHQSEASIHSQPTAWGLLCLQNSCRAGFIDFSAKFVLFYTFHLLVSEFYVKLRLILEKFVWFEWHGDESKCWSHILPKIRWQRLELWWIKICKIRMRIWLILKCLMLAKTIDIVQNSFGLCLKLNDEDIWNILSMTTGIFVLSAVLKVNRSYLTAD